MKLSIVILNWNGSEMLRTYLPTVLAHSHVDGVEVVVADNGSGDDSVEMLCRDFPEVRIIALEENYGFAEGYNRALREVESEYYLLLNSDVEISQDGWLTPLIGYMDEHPECGACQPKILSLVNPDMFEYAGAAGGFIDFFGYPYCRGRVLGRVERDEGQYDTVASLLWASGAALMVRASDYWNAGGLDDRFFAHMEEIDLCWRLRQMGKTVMCVPGSAVYHLGGGTLNKSNPHKTYLNFRNNLLLLYKNLPKGSGSWIRMAVRVALDALTGIGFFVTGNAADGKAVFSALKAFFKTYQTFRRDRVTNLSRRVLKRIPEHTGKLILFEYFKIKTNREK